MKHLSKTDQAIAAALAGELVSEAIRAGLRTGYKVNVDIDQHMVSVVAYDNSPSTDTQEWSDAYNNGPIKAHESLELGNPIQTLEALIKAVAVLPVLKKGANHEAA